MSTARDILNRARWARGDLHALAVTVVHRGAPGDVRTLSGARIVGIGPGGIALTPELAESEGVFVPYHRFLAIHAADGALLWDRRGAPEATAHAPVAATPRDLVAAQSGGRRVPGPPPIGRRRRADTWPISCCCRWRWRTAAASPPAR